MKYLVVFMNLVAVSACVSYLPSESSIVLPKRLALIDSTIQAAGEESITVPKVAGPQADKKLIQVADSVRDIDTALLRKRVDETHSPVQLEALLAARNIAVLEMLTGREILLNTAAGVFPQSSGTKIDSITAAIRVGLLQTTRKDIVNTSIGYAGPSKANLAIVFQDYESAMARKDEWSTYQQPQALKVGTYAFKVVAVEKNTSCTEMIVVLSEPTNRALCGRFNP